MSTFLERVHTFSFSQELWKRRKRAKRRVLGAFSASAKVRGHAENITREAPPPTRTSTHLRPPHLPRQRHRARNPPSPPARTHPRSPRRRSPPDSTTARPSRAAREREACRERSPTRPRRAGFAARADAVTRQTETGLDPRDPAPAFRHLP